MIPLGDWYPTEYVGVLNTLAEMQRYLLLSPNLSRNKSKASPVQHRFSLQRIPATVAC